jgi:LysR family nitrogen assimilation transcriptional regulator
VDIRQLRAFLAIADAGSVTRAAALLHVVQPAISRQLRLLEEELGAALFERGRLGMKLTDAGTTLVDYARRALRELERAKAEIQPKSGPVSGSATIGLLPSVCDFLSGPLLVASRRLYPDVRVRIAVGYAGHLEEWLRDGEVDAALLYDPKPSSSLQVQAILEEPLYLVGLPQARLGHRRPTPLAELDGVPLILPSAPHGLRTLIEHAFSSRHLNLTIAAETNSMAVQKHLVAHGIGLTVLPSVAVGEDVARKVLSASPICQPDLLRKIVLALPATQRSSVAVRCIVNELIALIRHQVESRKWAEAKWLYD